VDVLPEPRKPARRMVGIGFLVALGDDGGAPSTGDAFSRVVVDVVVDSVRDDNGEFE